MTIIEPEPFAPELSSSAPDSIIYLPPIPISPQAGINQTYRTALPMAMAPGSPEQEGLQFHQQLPLHASTMHHRSASGRPIRQPPHPDHSRNPMYPISHGMPLVSGPEPPGGQMTPRANQALGPLSIGQPRMSQVSSGLPRRAGPYNDSKTKIWPDKVAYAKDLNINTPSGPPGPHGNPRVPRSQQQQKQQQPGLPNPAKSTSDDIRQHEIAMSAQRYPSDPYQPMSALAIPATRQPPFMQQPGPPPRFSSRKGSVDLGLDVPSLGRPHYENPHDALHIQTLDAGSQLARTFSRPGYETQSTSAQIEQHAYSTNVRNRLQPRILSNPFPSTIFEAPEQEEGHTIRSAGPFPSQPSGRLSHGQPGFDFPEHARPSHHERPDPRLYDHTAPKAYRGRSQAPYGPCHSSENPANDARMGPAISRMPPSQPSGMDPRAYGRQIPQPQMQYAAQQPPFDHESRRFSLQTGNAPDRQQGQRLQSYERQAMWNQAPDDHVLYVRGVPNDKTVVLDMLKPFRGFVSVSNVKSSGNFLGDDVTYVFAT